ncbi:50S ribosomal protein L3 [Candidatus Parcubacteria bacterium]|nr:MAG: 50S ribosomal protein L3 [Candidatus Parcubacteria bacterium]
MSKFLIGKKVEMTQKFMTDGRVVPVTKILAGPCFIVHVKNRQKDGYDAVQLGFESTKKITEPIRGHLKNLGPFRFLKEFKIEKNTNLTAGQEIKADIFKEKEKVKVTGISKGKGFQGVVKRWGFSGQPKTHGHKDQSRMPGSLGAGGEQHVKKGKKMAGRTGGEKVTVLNLEVVEVDEKNNFIYIKGAVPGRRMSLLLLQAPGEITFEKKERQDESKEKTKEPAKEQPVKESNAVSDQNQK